MDKRKNLISKSGISKVEGIEKKAGIQKESEDTQLKSQSQRGFIEVDPVMATSVMSWFGALLVRSIFTFFTMELLRNWWKKFQDIYWPEQVKEEPKVEEPPPKKPRRKRRKTSKKPRNSKGKQNNGDEGVT